jgi:hypothetical protein
MVGNPASLKLRRAYGKLPTLHGSSLIHYPFWSMLDTDTVNEKGSNGHG